MAVLRSVLLFLVRLLAGPAAAREAGRAEQRAADHTTITETQREQIEIASRPAADRDALLERMRDGQL